MAQAGRLTYLEWTRVGDYVRLAVVDAATGLEVVVMGPADANPRTLERVGQAKLLRALERASAASRARGPSTSDDVGLGQDRKTPLPRQRGFTA